MNDECGSASRITAFFNVNRVPLPGIEPELAVGFDGRVETQPAVSRHGKPPQQLMPERWLSTGPKAAQQCAGLGSRMFLEVKPPHLAIVNDFAAGHTNVAHNFQIVTARFAHKIADE